MTYDLTKLIYNFFDINETSLDHCIYMIVVYDIFDALKIKIKKFECD